MNLGNIESTAAMQWVQRIPILTEDLRAGGLPIQEYAYVCDVYDSGA